MKHTQITLTVAAVLAAANLQALSLEVQKFEEGGAIPAGYQDVSDGIDAEAVLDVSADPFVDYLIPNNSGSAGITAQKDGGQYITSSNADTLQGANSGIDPDRFQVVYAWDDGTPLPFGADFYGVTWGGWSADDVTTLTTRVDLASDEPTTVYHWFNDGWNYDSDAEGGGHNVLSGHILTVTLYDAADTEIASESVTLPSGGAESFFSDHRQFYSSIITATRTAEGDYLIITNEGGNVGYKGTAVAIETSSPLSLEVQKFEEGGAIPAGYQDVSDGIDAEAVLDVSADPFVDYLIPNNSGSAGITAQKDGGQYITSSNADTLQGANSGIDPDRFQVVYAWDDGTPLPFGADFYGVTWGGWSADDVTTLTTRVDLASDEPTTVYHWFNDGWNYDSDAEGGGHNVLSGHILTVTLYDAADTEIASESVTLPSGGAESFFSDHRQFYSSIITATRTAEGDYLIITNEGGNVGYKGTAVAILESTGTTWNGFSVDAQGFADTGTWLNGVVFVPNPADDAGWIYAYALGKYVYVTPAGWVYIPRN